VPVVKNSLHVTRRIAKLNNYLHTSLTTRNTCLTTRNDSPEEGEIESFGLKNDSVLLRVAADIVDMYMAGRSQVRYTRLDSRHQLEPLDCLDV